MFICGGCKRPQVAYTKPIRKVIESRLRTYNNDGNITKGSEIVKEANLCQRCADGLDAELQTVIRH